MEPFLTRVWLLHGAFGGSTPGVLMYDNGNVSFATEEGQHFSVPVSEVKDLKFPFISFGMAMNITVNGQKYKISFMRPNGGRDMGEGGFSQLTRLTSIGRGMDGISSLLKMGDLKKVSKQWKEILS